MDLPPVEEIEEVWFSSLLEKGQRTNFFGFHAVHGPKVGEDHDSMADYEAKDHHTDKKGRESCEEPQNHDSRFHKLQEGLFSFVDNPIGEIPKLKDPDAHIEAEKVKALEIAVADAGLGPDAVMIHFVLTFLAGATVMDSGEFVILAWATVLVGG